MSLLTKGKTNWKYILIVLVLAIIVGGGIYKWITLKKVKLPKEEEIKIREMFKVVEGIYLIKVESEPLSEDLLGKENTFFGLLQDTGVLNMLYTYRFDGEKAFLRRYFLKRRIYQGGPKNPIWVKIIGKYSNIKIGYEEIDADIFEKVDEIVKKIEKNKSNLCKWVRENRRLYDLNNYKQTKRFKEAFSESFKNTDLNKLKFRPADALVFIDFDKMVAGIDCGESILSETPIRGDYLAYYAIYNLNNEKLIKVIIVNTGYILE
jgi:hypothetical protein